MLCTFEPSPEVKLEKLAVDELEMMCLREEVRRKPAPQLLRESALPKTALRHHGGFVGACLECYNMHHHLVLDPNAVWLAILSQFAVYVDLHAERLRARLVKHAEGKVQLEVSEVATLATAHFEKLSQTIVQEMDAHLQEGEVRAWALPDFSTTTATDRAVGALMLMGAMQTFFGYKIQLCCGLPKVSLTGTVQDWRALELRATKLVDFDLPDNRLMSKWTAMLLPVLRQFVRSAEGAPDLGFWRKICSIQGNGSGPRHVTGWLCVFSVFDNERRWVGDARSYQGTWLDWPIIDCNDLSRGVVECPVLLDDNGEEMNCVFEASVAGLDAGPSGDMVKPMSCWRLVRAPSKDAGRQTDEEPLVVPVAKPLAPSDVAVQPPRSREPPLEIGHRRSGFGATSVSDALVFDAHEREAERERRQRYLHEIRTQREQQMHGLMQTTQQPSGVGAPLGCNLDHVLPPSEANDDDQMAGFSNDDLEVARGL